MDHDNENLFVTLNCVEEHQDLVESNPIPNHMLELSGMQNIFELLFPFPVALDLSNMGEMEKFYKKLFLREFSFKSKTDLDSMLPTLMGSLNPHIEESVALTENAKILDFVGGKVALQDPGIFTSKDTAYDAKIKSKLDQTTLRSNMFFQFTGP